METFHLYFSLVKTNIFNIDILIIFFHHFIARHCCTVMMVIQLCKKISIFSISYPKSKSNLLYILCFHFFSSLIFHSIQET